MKYLIAQKPETWELGTFKKFLLNENGSYSITNKPLATRFNSMADAINLRQTILDKGNFIILEDK